MSKYEEFSKEDLIRLLVKRDSERRLGLVWERDQIEHERALNDDYVFLEQDQTLSEGEGPYENLVIEGDNFDALRYLNLTHKGKIKCIYIDPPYNTGNKDFVYNDHFIKEEDSYRHSTWLEFLYRRLLLAKDLLREDGVLLVSINDANRSKLELLLDEVFPGMRAGSFVWRSRSGDNRKKGVNLSVNQEHVLAYAMPGFSFRGDDKTYSDYSNPDKDPRGDWASRDLSGPATYKERPNTYYPIQDPSTGVWYPCNPNRVWVYASRNMLTEEEIKSLQEKPMEDLIAENRIKWPDNPKTKTWNSMEELLEDIQNGDVPTSGSGDLLLREDLPNLEFFIGKTIGWGTPRRKKFKSELNDSVQPVSSWIRPKSEDKYADSEGEEELQSGFTDEGSKLVKSIFGEKLFQFPKPLSLVQALIIQSSCGDDMVLDFFAGSATTAHAVLEQNRLDGQKRKFIMVSSTEATHEEPEKNVCRDITAERIRRVMNGYSKVKGTGGNFAYFRAVRIQPEDIYAAIQHDQIWNALQLLHFDTVQPYVSSEIHIFESENKRIVYIQEVSEDAISKLSDILTGDTKTTTVYSWQPGIIKHRLFSEHMSIEQIPTYLIERFGGAR